MEQIDFERLRLQMVQQQLADRDIRDQRVLKAMRQIPRELFVPEHMRAEAYLDQPVTIDCGQTVSQPYMVGLMSSLLRLTGAETVLEIGTGFGYQAAVLAKLAKKVYSVEQHADLARTARAILGKLDIKNVEIMVGDGSEGLSKHAPFDGIIVTAAAPEVPVPLMEQLTPAGRLVVPVGGKFQQCLQLVERAGDEYETTDICGCRFVPLIGKHGWEH